MVHYVDAFNQIAEVASRVGVSFSEATEAFRILAQMGYDIATKEDVITGDIDLRNRIGCLEHQVYNGAADCEITITSTIDPIKNDLAELQTTVRQLQSEIDVLTENPKQKPDLEIFEAIFDNSDFPLLENNIFPEIDFNIKI